MHLRAERKRPETVDNYTTGVRPFIAGALVEACSGNGFRDRHDEAIVRAGEVSR